MSTSHLRRAGGAHRGADGDDGHLPERDLSRPAREHDQRQADHGEHDDRAGLDDLVDSQQRRHQPQADDAGDRRAQPSIDADPGGARPAASVAGSPPRHATMRSRRCRDGDVRRRCSNSAISTAAATIGSMSAGIVVVPPHAVLEHTEGDRRHGDGGQPVHATDHERRQRLDESSDADRRCRAARRAPCSAGTGRGTRARRRAPTRSSRGGRRGCRASPPGRPARRRRARPARCVWRRGTVRRRPSPAERRWRR